MATPCLNGGVCTDGLSMFTCDCVGTGYSGATCATGKLRCFGYVPGPPLVFRAKRLLIVCGMGVLLFGCYALFFLCVRCNVSNGMWFVAWALLVRCERVHRDDHSPVVQKRWRVLEHGRFFHVRLRRHRL